MNFESLTAQQAVYTANLQTIAPDALAQKLNEFHVAFSHISTQLHGNSLTIEDARLLINQGIVVGGKKVVEINEVINNHHATVLTEKSVEQKLPLNEQMIIDIHTKVCRNIIRGGEYRTEAVAVDNPNWAPPVGDAVAAEIAQFYANLLRTDLNPIELAAWTRAEFTRIRPFIKGNNRTARILMNYQLMLNNFPPVLITPDEYPTYTVALDQYYVENNIAPLADFVATIVERRMTEFGA